MEPDGSTPGPASGTEATDRRLGRALLAIAMVWAVIGLYVVHSQLPSNTLELPGEDRLAASILIVAPQGWAFFTKSPRDPVMELWVPGTGADWRPALDGPHAEPRNAFGFNRRSRAQPVEMGLLASLVPADRWVDCDRGDIASCLNRAPVTPVDNTSPQPLLCGQFGFSQRPPLPWAWAGAADDTLMPATVLRLDIRCGSGSGPPPAV